ncbi:MAG: SWIM zinc finger family protein [Chloroflexi bacterium]|nr:SWIM zinc finger family protein [Chloroflexota bacterium]
MSWWYPRYKPTSPIAVKGGIKARSQRGAIGKSWWAQRWTGALRRIMDSGRLSRGRSYARRGQVMDIHIQDDEITAKVQGSRRTPYKVSIRVQPLKDADWDRVLDVLVRQAIFTAQLLAGEMPTDIEEAFAAANISLFPASAKELATNCSCPDWANPCKHIAAVYFLLGEAFDDDPFMLFRLRGRTQEQVLEGLRVRRGALEEEEGEDGLDPTALPAEETAPAPLPEDPSVFWRLGQPLDDFQVQPKAPQVSLSLLQRLGQPTFAPADLRSSLSAVYQEVTQRAEALAFGEEVEES